MSQENIFAPNQAQKNFTSGYISYIPLCILASLPIYASLQGLNRGENGLNLVYILVRLVGRVPSMDEPAMFGAKLSA